MSKDLNSREVTKGTERAPHRSLLYAMGWDKTNLEKPKIKNLRGNDEDKRS